MMELPESKTLAKQGNHVLKNLIISDVKILSSPHRFCWMNESPERLEIALIGKRITQVKSSAHYLRIMLDDGSELTVAEDVTIEYKKIEHASDKHQLLLIFDHGFVLAFKIKLYGFVLYGFEHELIETLPYYKKAILAIDPLDKKFTFEHFLDVTQMNTNKGTIKKALATDQHIPGLGNGILQDICFHAKLSPKRKIETLTEIEKKTLYQSLLHTIDQMVLFEGRDTTSNFFGEKGNYEVLMKSTQEFCPICEEKLIKEAYLGGKIIYCKICQK
jgi:formamidopyrimidine-DNA glycosylase